MKDNINKSLLMRKWPVSVIPNPININIWSPINREIARDNLSLPKNLDLILFGSASGSKASIRGFDLYKKL